MCKRQTKLNMTCKLFLKRPIYKEKSFSNKCYECKKSKFLSV